MATKQYVDYTEEEYFDAEVSLDGEDIKLTPKNDRALNFTGTILINGSEPQTGAEVQADWAETDDTKADFIKNKPTIPAAQIQSDWAQTDSAEVDYIKNKPTIPDAVSVTQVQSTGTKIATITVGSTGTDIYAPSGGGLTNLVDGSATGSVRGIGAAADGSGYTIGNYSVAEGYNTKAAGFDAHAEGYNTKASSGYAHAEGSSTTASGTASHAEGNTTVASGENSHAEGEDIYNFWPYHLEASGQASHAEGRNSKASGVSSHAEGCRTIASGIYSHTSGEGTTANHFAQFSFGAWNIADPSTAAATARGTYVEIVGNGTSKDATSNARTLDWSGNENIAGMLRIGSAGNTGGVLLKEDSGSLKISFDDGTTWLTVSAS